MSAYTDRVAHNLKGLEAVSTGLCSGCNECFSTYGEHPTEDDEGAWVFDGKTYETEDLALAAAKEAFRDDWSSGKVFSEPSFSWQPCDICGCSLGGDRECWHFWLDGKLQHSEGACVDCVGYLANGEEPGES